MIYIKILVTNQESHALLTFFSLFWQQFTQPILL